MDQWLTPAIISLIVTGAIQIVGSQLKAKNLRGSSSISRDQEVADRFYDDLKDDIEKLKRQLNDAENRANKWQEQYYQLYAKYQILKAQFEHSAKQIQELTKSLDELKKALD